MPARITFLPGAEAEGPPAWRLVLTDDRGRFIEPVESLFACRNEPAGRAWAYGGDRVIYELSPGHYFWCASAGFEWTMTGGQFRVGGPRPIDIAVRLRRIADAAAEGFVSGDTHVHAWRKAQEPSLEVPFLAEGLDLAGAQCWGLYTGGSAKGTPPRTPLFRCGRAWVSTDQEVEMHSPWGVWEDTTVMGLTAPLPDLCDGFGYRMNAPYFLAARERNCAMIVYQAPTWAQFLVDVGLGLVDSVNVCDNFLSMTQPEEGPWDYTQFGGDDPLQREPRGIAQWAYNAWYRVLNAGVPLPCSGGSAYPGGGGGGPLGMNRFYIQSQPAASPETWFREWREGATFATNGPLLFAELDGRRPSADFIAPGPAQRAVVRVISNRPLSRIEWVADGAVIAERLCDEREYPVETLWETTLDLRRRAWVAARAFGRSERVLAGYAGWVSPPFLTAHTSPFYLENYLHGSEARESALHDIIERLEWMQRVLRGVAQAPFATRPVGAKALGAAEREEIFSYLSQATQRWQLEIG